MKYNPQIHHRRSIRLKGYDYASEGIYFVTICTLDKKCLFGDVIDGEMRLNELGKIVRDEWMRTPEIRPDVALDRMVVMPNHLHGIIVIQRKRNGDNLVGANSDSPLLRKTPFRSPSRTIGAMVRGFKGVATKRVNVLRRTPGMPLWQRGYHDHIVRDGADLDRIRQYVLDNPVNWCNDDNFPGNIRMDRAHEVNSGWSALD